MNPLYITGIAEDGNLLLGGLYKMKAEVGFPIDLSRDICRENKIHPDCFELMCDAWLHDCLGFDSICRELETYGMISNRDVRKWRMAGTIWFAEHPEVKNAENPVNEFCKAMLDKKREASKAFTGWSSQLIKLAEALKSQPA